MSVCDDVSKSFNPLIPGGNKKVTHLNLQLSAG